MSAQLSLMPNEKQLTLQRKMLEELIEFKSQEIHHQEFHNFYGTAEEIAVKREAVDKKISAFVKRVDKAFPDVLS